MCEKEEEEKDGCHNCINGKVQKGYGIGNFEYWCHKQNGQKSKYTHCFAYRKQE